MTCAACGTAAPDGARFCPGCGARLEQAAGPAETVRHERRLLTVLFADLVGFTAASDGADPEDVRARVEPFHALVRREAAATGGTVGRVVGDGVMVVWGYPVVREDDALRALRTAVGIRDGMPALEADRHVRIGVNSGEAIVAFGSSEQRADDALGDALNVAARLAAAAPVDGIVAGEATTRLAGDHVHAHALPPLTLKGKAAPVPACLVEGIAAPTHRHPGGSAPQTGRFVGRGPELEALWAGLARAREERRVTRVLVTGEPGIGKSRLLGELRHAAHRHGDVPWHTGRCRPEAGSPAWALGEIVKGWAGIGDDDPPGVASGRLEDALALATPDRDWLLDRLGRLVGLDSAGAASSGELAVAWARFLGLLASDGPAVVEIEDVHWADAELAAFLSSEVLTSQDVPLLVLVTGRPETLTLHPALAVGATPHLALAPLADEDAAAIVAEAVGSARLSPGERLALVARGGGNPLFTTELVRYVAQRAAAGIPAGGRARPDLPDTVQAVIAARLELLAPGTRAIIRDAAVVGATFWRGALAALETLDPGRDVGVDDGLAGLVGLELVRPRHGSTLPGDVELAFRHALVRDVAYGQLTRGDRAIRHARTAQWLSGAAGAGRGDLAAIIADHDLAALDLSASTDAALDREAVAAHAVEHLLVAASSAARIDPLAAADRYRAAADLADDEATRLRALRGLVAASRDRGDYRDALATAGAAIELATRLGDTEATGMMLLERGRVRRPLGDERWYEDGIRATELLESAPPGPALVEAYAFRTFMEMTMGSGTDCIAWADRAEQTAASIGIPAPGSAIVRRAFARAMFGDPGAIADGERGVEAARLDGDSNALANALSDLGGCHVYLGNATEAVELLHACLDVCRARGLRAIEALSLMNLGYLYRVLGRWDDAETTYTSALRLAATTQDPTRPIWIEEDRQYLLHERGDGDAADALVAWLEASVREAAGDSTLGEDLLASARLLAAGRRGDLEGVRRASLGIYLQTEDGDLDGREATKYLPLARVAARLGGADVVERIVATVSRRCPLGAAIHDTLQGLVATARGSHAEAAEAFVTVIPAWDRMGYVPEAALARQFAGEHLLAVGRHTEALELLETAHATFERLGARRGLRETADAIKRASAEVRSPRAT